MYNCYLYSTLRSRSRDVHGDERGQLYQRRRHFGKLSWQTVWTILIFLNSLSQIYFLDILSLKVETTVLINFCVQRLTLTFPIKESPGIHGIINYLLVMFILFWSLILAISCRGNFHTRHEETSLWTLIQ